MAQLHGTWRSVAKALGLALSFAVSTLPAHAQDAGGGAVSGQAAYCHQLERDLAPDWAQAINGRDAVQRIEAQMARADQQFQRLQNAAEKSDCFDYFLFSKSWRDTAQCRQIHQQTDDAQRALADLDRQRRGASSAQDRAGRQEALVSELARYKCGPQYEAAMQRRNGIGFGAGDFNDAEGQSAGNPATSFPGGVAGSTFRTICVRTCDGYYFPISFAATQDHFQRDAQACQSQCAGPAKLYYYPNPGGEVQQAVSLDGTAYKDLHNAFRYRKELVASCTCKAPAEGSETLAVAPPNASPVPAMSGAQAEGAAAPAADQASDQAGDQFGTLTVETEPPAKPAARPAPKAGAKPAQLPPLSSAN